MIDFNQRKWDKNVIVEIGMFSGFTLFFVVWYLSIKINSIKTVGMCKENLECYHGNKGMFKYEIEGIQHYSCEKKAHYGKCKAGKEYTIYVNKNNYDKFVSEKFLGNLKFMMLFVGIYVIILCYSEFILT